MRVWAIAGLLWIFSFTVFSFPATTTAEKTNLVLNGTGFRTATIFKVKVYEAALYLKEKSSSAEGILNSLNPKQLQLHFLRDVKKQDIQNAWEDSFKKICEPHCAQIADSFGLLKNAMRDMKEGEEMIYTFSPEKLEVRWKTGPPLTISSSTNFSSIILSTWLGNNSPYPALREKLLGIGSK